MLFLFPFKYLLFYLHNFYCLPSCSTIHSKFDACLHTESSSVEILVRTESDLSEFVKQELLLCQSMPLFHSNLFSSESSYPATHTCAIFASQVNPSNFYFYTHSLDNLPPYSSNTRRTLAFNLDFILTLAMRK